MEKERLDVIMVQRGLAESRALAQRLVMAGQVRVGGQVMLKPAVKVLENADIHVELGPKYVSRGGDKLEAAINSFGLTDLSGFVCADVGASTGGFTDCMLQMGAEKVYAIDVGYGVLHWKLRSDPRVIIMERTNARYVMSLPESVDLVVVDASFISLKILLPVIVNWFNKRTGRVVALIKPQFEAGREDTAKGDGVIRDAGIHRKVLEDILSFVTQNHFKINGLIRSPLLGPKGNTEFLVDLVYPTDNDIDWKSLVDAVVPNQREN